MSQVNVQVIIAAVTFGIAFAVLTAAIFVSKKLLTKAKNIFSLWLPIKTAADTLQGKLNIEKERIADHSDLHQLELENLVESTNILFADWNAFLLINQKELEGCEGEVEKQTIGLSTFADTNQQITKFPGMIRSISVVMFHGQQCQNSLNVLAHKSCALAEDMLSEINSILAARHHVSEECTLEDEQYEILLTTNSDIYKLRRQVLKFLDNVKPHMAKLSTRSFRNQVRDQVLMDAPEVPQDQVELLLKAEEGDK